MANNNQQILSQLKLDASGCKTIPETTDMVTVSSLMTLADHALFKGGNIVALFVDVPHTSSGQSQIFSVRPQQLVPRTAVIQRDETSQAFGISAISGG